MQLPGLLRALGGNVSGNALTIFAFAIPAMFGMAGLALDFSRVQAAKQMAQNTLDSALFAASANQTLTDDMVQETVAAYFARQGSMKHDAVMANLVARVENGSKVYAEASVRVPTTLLTVLGFQQFTARIASRVTRGLGNVEIALVLDTTGSMEGTRISNLKSAANQLIDTLYALPDASTKVKVGVVPFAQYVNVGMANRNASWMSVPADTTVTEERCYATYPTATSSNCRTQRFSSTRDGEPYSYDGNTCDWEYGSEVMVCSPATSASIWNGCAGARSNPLNIKDEQYTTPIPGIRNVSCPSPILPLTNQVTDIRSSIDTLNADGYTYIPTGLVWGWRVLSNREPFVESVNDPATANGQVRKYLVLMTDGSNTRSPQYSTGDHEGSDTDLSNQLTRDACDNIKADYDSKIEIFTIAFEVTNEPIKEILRYCATPGGAFYDAVDYSRLLTAFSEIGANVAVARLDR